MPMRGYYDTDRFWPHRMAVRGMVGIEWQMARRWYLRAEGRPVFSIQTLRRNDIFGTRDDFYFLFEHAAEAEYRLDNGLRVLLMPDAEGPYTRTSKVPTRPPVR